jgi:hypothetical protein
VEIAPLAQQPVVLESVTKGAYSLSNMSNTQPALPAGPRDVVVDPSLAQGAAYGSGSATEQPRSAKSSAELLGSHPLLFDSSSLLGGALAAAAYYSTEALKGGPPDGLPHPLSPIELPSGPAPAGSNLRGGGSGMGIGLDLLAILALVLVLSRTGGSSVSPREGFKLVSSPRLVTELPG